MAQIHSKQNELLIRLDEKVSLILDDVKKMSISLSVLQESKLDKTEAYRMQADSSKIHDDHEKRIRSVEDRMEATQTMIKTWGSIGGIVLGGLQALQIILYYFHR